MNRVMRVILIVAVCLRVASAVYQGDSVVPLPGTYDQVSYHELAVRVLEGHGFSFGTGWWPATRAGEPTAHWSFLYVLYLAAVYAAVGIHPLVARLLQAVLAGLLQPWLTWRLGSRFFGERVGLIGAGIAAVYAYFVYYAGSLITETFYLVAILWALDRATTMAAKPAGSIRVGSWVHLGLALGCTVLLRQVFLFMVPLVLLYLGWQLAWKPGISSGGLKRFARGGAVSLLVIGFMIVPWTVRNYRAFDRLVLLNTNAGFAFFWGNHPIHGYFFIPILPGAESGSGTPGYGDLIPDDLRHLSEAALDQALMQRGIGFVLADPVRYLVLSASRAVEYFKFWPTPDSGLVSNLSRVGSFGVCLPFMLAGLVLSLARFRPVGALPGGGVNGCSATGNRKGSSSLADHEGRSREGTVLLLGLAGAYTLLHLGTWALVRYRVPVDALTILFAAVAMSRAYELLGPRLNLSEINRPTAKVGAFTKGMSCERPNR